MAKLHLTNRFPLDVFIFVKNNYYSIPVGKTIMIQKKQGDEIRIFYQLGQNIFSLGKSITIFKDTIHVLIGASSVEEQSRDFFTNTGGDISELIFENPTPHAIAIFASDKQNNMVKFAICGPYSSASFRGFEELGIPKDQKFGFSILLNDGEIKGHYEFMVPSIFSKKIRIFDTVLL